MPALNVSKITETQAAKIKAVSKEREISIAALVRQWINGLKLRGDKK